MKSRRPRTARLHDLYTSPEPGASLLNAPVWCSRSPGGGGPPRKSGFHKNFLRKVQCVLPDDKKHTHTSHQQAAASISHTETQTLCHHAKAAAPRRTGPSWNLVLLDRNTVVHTQNLTILRSIRKWEGHCRASSEQHPRAALENYKKRLSSSSPLAK